MSQYLLANGLTMESVFEDLSVEVIRSICRRHVNIRSADSNSRARIYQTISSYPADVQDRLVSDAQKLKDAGVRRYKRRREAHDENDEREDDEEVEGARRKKKRRTGREQREEVETVLEDVEMESAGNVVDDVQSLIDGPFMKPPSQSTVDDCIEEFINATNNDTLKLAICIACAQECGVTEASAIKIADIPNAQRLRPTTPHRSHELTDGMLLYGPAILSDDPSRTHICHDCKRALLADKTPKLSLANNMWIGDVPKELSILTLPERMLVAIYFPAAYIIKLYPKQRGAKYWDSRQMHRGLRGNVSTYRLDPTQVASMVTGNLMPRPPRILSATIGVTFVGPSGLTEKTMPTMFRVRRAKIQAALTWLKENNPLYSQIEISVERLDELPEDGVPDEILSTTKHSSDLEAVYKEHDGYVPSQDVDEEEHLLREAGLTTIDDDVSEAEVEPQIVPLETMGVVDIEGTDISDRELMAHALANTADRNMSEDFSIRRGSAFVNEYARVDSKTGQRNDGGPSNPNHLLGSFPTLFPYGVGGLETLRPINVPYETHVRWALRYADKRFRLDPQFAFQVFGVCQKRQVCRSAALQIKKSGFAGIRNLIATLTPEDLFAASKEETENKPFSNPAIVALRGQVKAVRTRVQGTDEARQHVRSKIWSTNLVFNPPALWVTINPADTQDPIAQIFAGVDIDLDRFSKTAGPDSAARAVNISQDPFASAKFFHFMINTILQVLFGIRKRGDQGLERKDGVLGKVQSYIGTVEAQGRGTLHLHLLLWLQGAPSSRLMQEALQTEGFRNKVRDYVKTVISADIKGLNDEKVRKLPREKEVSYSRPINPKTHPKESEAHEQQLARTLQYHQCSTTSCLRVVKGRLKCKRRAPFRLALEAWVNANGDWNAKRMCQFLNNWCPAILKSLRANHDIKLMMNGAENEAVSFYITCYATKKRDRSSNTSALLAKSFAFHQAEDKKQKDLNLLNKKMIQRCANSLTRDHEFSGPEIIAYLMGWGDVFESHHYVAIYWEAAVKALKRSYPGLHREGRHGLNGGEGEETREIISFSDGAVALRDQLKDYQFRGDELEHMNLFTFLLETYDSMTPENGGEEETRRPGRPRNLRFPYKEEAGKPTRCRVQRSAGHETLPRFIGRWFPRNDDPDMREMYCASMLMLLMPWRDLSDLKDENDTFDITFRRFDQTCDRKTRTVLENIQFYHQSSDAAKAKRREEAAGGSVQQIVDFEFDREDEDTNEGDEQQYSYDFEPEVITEADIIAAREALTAERDRRYGQEAIAIAKSSGIFKEQMGEKIYDKVARLATPGEVDQFNLMDAALKSATRRQSERDGVTNMASLEVEIRTIPLTENPPSEAEPSPTTIPSSSSLASSSVTPSIDRSAKDPLASTEKRPKLKQLNAEQRRAHDIVESVLKKQLAGEPVEQLRMMILGPGGTGKSTVIGAITETFEFYGVGDKLAKCAATGIAASDIGGKTLHSWAGLRRRNGGSDWLEKSSDTSKEKRKRNIQGMICAIIDEVSMVDKVGFFNTSEVMAHVRAEEGTGELQDPFGGCHMILTGDFHQFPPVGNSTGALYYDKSNDSAQALIGREYFLQFDTVVMLTQQNRVKDPVWTGILEKLRVGECEEKDLEEIRKLVITHKNCDKPDFTSDPWKQAILVTPRHSVRQQWNREALKRHCEETGKRRYIVPAEDTINNKKEPLPIEARLATAKLTEKQKGKLPDEVEIAIGMRAMVTINLATEADIANGTRGTITDIVLDPREEDLIEESNGTIRLRHPPVALIFKPDGKCDIEFPGLKKGEVPIIPSTATFTVTTLGGKTYKARRKQLAVTAGYAFTDYKSQGQTIEYVLIDIARTPTGRLSPFSAYVALSRSRGRDTIRLLRDFDEELFVNHPEEKLAREMRRLKELDRLTKEKYEQR